MRGRLYCFLFALFAAPPLAATTDDAAARILGAALVDDSAYRRLAFLSDRIGHRLSGSPALERAIAWSVAEMKRNGLEPVWTEEVLVPHWVRGRERARIVEPVESEIALLGLGGTVPTPPGGLTATVAVVRDFDGLEALGESARGKIVLYDQVMVAGSSMQGYGAVVKLRTEGAIRAAKLGAVASLVRSLGTASFRLPHTGAMKYDPDVEKIPAAAISAEDADWIRRLHDAGATVRVHLELGAETLPDATSANVLADIRGRERPDEIVLIGAHLDSWDVGQGAIDDGAGCVIVMEAMRILHDLGLVPRRTIRAVLFTNEENGLRGGKDYARRHGAETHVAAIESDSGADVPLGFGVKAGDGAVEIVARLAGPLASIGAHSVMAGGGGADISTLEPFGVPVMNLRQDTTRYFDYHHTAADTLDKIDPAALARNVAALAVMAWALAEDEETLPRLETTPASE